MPAESHQFAAILFDLDGTIIDSKDAIVKHWHRIADELGFDAEEVLRTSHGRRSIDTLALYDASKANWDYVYKIEGLIPKLYGASAVEIPGARAILRSLNDCGHDAPWAVVTSGTRPLVQGWLEVLGLEEPRCLVVAEDVANGKPDPACYNLGRSKLGLLSEGAEVLVVEDAPAGIRAGKAAGCMVLGLVTTHSAAQVHEAGADWVVRDLTSLALKGWDRDSGRMTVEISNAIHSPGSRESKGQEGKE